MNYFSTNRLAQMADFREASIRGQAPDKGLYFPEFIPQADPSFLKNLHQLTEAEIAYRVIRPYTGDCIPEDVLYSIVSETVNFPVPLVKLTDHIFSLELYHGNTLAFKDIGARFMSRCLGYFVRNMNRQVTVLVATSGDTGGAVADGFYGVEGVRVIILYPDGKVSRVQEKQLTGYGGNIQSLKVKGSFDDCQRMVKQAFANQELSEKLFLTSANSINVARWLPQQFFYFFALRQWPAGETAPVISVPSGNFGNICAGLLARQSGLPVQHFIAACNANDTVADYLQHGTYQSKKSIPTISNAMDVGDPSNFIRISEMFSHNYNRIKAAMSAESFTDAQTKEAMFRLFEQYQYLADPHGAVGFLALEHYLSHHPHQKGIFLETAHPVKFFDVVEPVIGKQIELPEQVRALMDQPDSSVPLDATDQALTDWLWQLPS